MKPYGVKAELRRGKCEKHTADNCRICSTTDWKISKKRERANAMVADREKGGE